MKIKLTRPYKLGTEWKNPGEVIEAEGETLAEIEALALGNPVEEAAGDQAEPAQGGPQPLDAMKKDDLLTMAEGMGLEASKAMNKADIIKLIEDAKAKQSGQAEPAKGSEQGQADPGQAQGQEG